MRGAGTRWIQRGSMPEGHGTRTPDLYTPNELLSLGTSELALEQSREFLVLRRLLAVWDTFRTWLVREFRRSNRVRMGKIILTVLRGCWTKI